MYPKNGNRQRKWKTERGSKVSKTREPTIAENSWADKNTERRSKTSKTRKPEIQGKLSMIIEKKMIA